MRHEHQIDACRGKGELHRIGPQGRSRTPFSRTDRRGVHRQPAMLDTIGTQTLQPRQTQLQGVVAKTIGHQFIVALLFPRQQVAARR